MERKGKLITGRLTVYLCLLTAVVGLMMSLRDCKSDKSHTNMDKKPTSGYDSVDYHPVTIVED